MSNERWDYFIVTAANGEQARSYEAHLKERLDAGQLKNTGTVLVVEDPGGRRIGSGGSTLQCLREVLQRESGSTRPAEMEAILRRLRILIVHAGGDSRRLPAYSPCGKIFIPLPCDTPSDVAWTLFDRLVPVFFRLPPGESGAGQVVITSGDALIEFDADSVRFSEGGITALGAPAAPEDAARHGVLCPNIDGSVRLYMQKPAVQEQADAGAIGRNGESVLDIGVMSMDAPAAATLLQAFESPASLDILSRYEIDLYREICCALGTEATLQHYLKSARSSRSKLNEAELSAIFDALHSVPLHVQVLPRCTFRHFGSTSQLISSGIDLITEDRGAPPESTVLSIGNLIEGRGRIHGGDSWVEGCHIEDLLALRGRNVVVGVDINVPLELPPSACLDIAPANDRQFIRCYGVDDTFKSSVDQGATFCGIPLPEWLRLAGGSDATIWDDETPEGERTLWNAKMFPAETEPDAFRRWLWMFNPASATTEQKQSFLAADRYSSAEIAVLADHVAFRGRRTALSAGAGLKY